MSEESKLLGISASLFMGFIYRYMGRMFADKIMLGESYQKFHLQVYGKNVLSRNTFRPGSPKGRLSVNTGSRGYGDP